MDLVLTIGGDGTLLETSHHLDERIPVLGINSDPTSQEEVRSEGVLLVTLVAEKNQKAPGLLILR